MVYLKVAMIAGPKSSHHKGKQGFLVTIWLMMSIKLIVVIIHSIMYVHYYAVHLKQCHLLITPQ